MGGKTIKDYVRPIAYAYYGRAFRSAECQSYLRSFGDIPSAVDSVKALAESGKSLARFGDGEFNWIFGRRSASFQKADPVLSENLRRVLLSDCQSVEITVPGAFNPAIYERMSDAAKYFWHYWIGRNWKDIRQVIGGCDRAFLNTDISRPYIQFLNREEAVRAFGLLKGIWDGKDVLIVEGLNTNLGVYTDLFDSCASRRRVLCPPKDAFDFYDAIKECVIENVKQGDIVLLSLGPTATVLAHDLAAEGIRALDIGHIDVEYEWCLQNATGKVLLEHHTVAECGGGFEGGFEGYRGEVVDMIGVR